MRLFGIPWVSLLVSTAASVILADEPPAPADASQARLQFLQSAIRAFEATSPDLDGLKLEFPKSAALRYSDPTRRVIDAGLWRLGQEGRPAALVTLELYRHRTGRIILTYEFVSLAPAPLSVQSPPSIAWQPPGAEFAMHELAEAPAPADSPAKRLTQMRNLAEQFSVREDWRGLAVECRLMRQPIDRYRSDEGIADGAVFLFANGTNPELALLIETDGKDWQYGLVRLGAAQLFVARNETRVGEFARIVDYAPTRNYYSIQTETDLPGE